VRRADNLTTFMCRLSTNLGAWTPQGLSRPVMRLLYLFLEEGGWSTPHSGHFTPEKDPAPIAQEAGLAPGPFQMGEENIASIGVRTPNGPTHSESLYRPNYMQIIISF
jgi:hypothetical protein